MPNFSVILTVQNLKFYGYFREKISKRMTIRLLPSTWSDDEPLTLFSVMLFCEIMLTNYGFFLTHSSGINSYKTTLGLTGRCFWAIHQPPTSTYWALPPGLCRGLHLKLVWSSDDFHQETCRNSYTAQTYSSCQGFNRPPLLLLLALENNGSSNTITKHNKIIK